MIIPVPQRPLYIADFRGISRNRTYHQSMDFLHHVRVFQSLHRWYQRVSPDLELGDAFIQLVTAKRLAIKAWRLCHTLPNICQLVLVPRIRAA